ncbi:hypothetical protein K504DRAFT_234763 [Pleomassaria siparia CBS 279.74]|uniref:Uncharacterized protein n=1 Tax=Pleomassaria siparia CBS 279.74 TaxID=1314801 RepID=A0A6G1KD78_9PLEO|nr:hypothetical protein K504DRAFT_234763 [Pleomassaria siparia CBS 279.74]
MKTSRQAGRQIHKQASKQASKQVRFACLLACWSFLSPSKGERGAYIKPSSPSPFIHSFIISSHHHHLTTKLPCIHPSFLASHERTPTISLANLKSQISNLNPPNQVQQNKTKQNKTKQATPTLKRK